MLAQSLIVRASQFDNRNHGMNVATQAWFWTAIVSGLTLVALFFFAYYKHREREVIFGKVMRQMKKNSSPPDPSDLAAATLIGKRAFRVSNLFYTLALAYFKGG